jgi:kynureninase
VDRAAAVALDAEDPIAGWRSRFRGAEGLLTVTEGRSPAAEGPLTAAEGPFAAAEGPLTAGEGPFAAAEGGGPIYLDGNSLGRPAAAVAEALGDALRDWSEKLVGGWPRWIDLPGSVGDRVGGLIGAGPGQVVVCDSTTVNLYKLASAALSARTDRRVILGDADDFPTDRYVLQGLAEATGRELRLLRGSPTEGLAADEVAAAIDEQVALVCLSHVNFRSGARLDPGAVTAAAHRNGALILWDLSHSAGAIPVDLDQAGADLAVGCTYKYLNSGPGAPAFLYVRRDLQTQLRQPIWGWFGQRDQFAMGPTYDPEVGMGRFLTGTPSVLGLVAVDASVAILEAAGIPALWAKSQRLTAMMSELVGERLEPLGATFASPRDPARRGAHISVAHPRAWPWCRALIDRKLVVGDFRPPDVIRLGPAPLYTRFVDVFDALERMEGVLAAGLPEAGARPRVT